MTGSQYHCKVLQGSPRLLPTKKDESALSRTSLVREIFLPKTEFLGVSMHTQEKARKEVRESSREEWKRKGDKRHLACHECMN